ncbi:MAG: SPOR domain-containing protein [Deltaproteobacteria bacterium]|jgi:hypothetical protein|nr:SPOR domain-containing protein [Deltaproteobacteria bacterium]
MAEDPKAPQDGGSPSGPAADGDGGWLPPDDDPFEAPESRRGSRPTVILIGILALGLVAAVYFMFHLATAPLETETDLPSFRPPPAAPAVPAVPPAPVRPPEILTSPEEEPLPPAAENVPRFPPEPSRSWDFSPQADNPAPADLTESGGCQEEICSPASGEPLDPEAGSLTAAPETPAEEGRTALDMFESETGEPASPGSEAAPASEAGQPAASSPDSLTVISQDGLELVDSDDPALLAEEALAAAQNEGSVPAEAAASPESSASAPEAAGEPAAAEPSGLESAPEAAGPAEAAEAPRPLEVVDQADLTDEVPAAPAESSPAPAAGSSETETAPPAGPSETEPAFPAEPSEAETAFPAEPSETETAFPAGPSEAETAFPAGPSETETVPPAGPSEIETVPPAEAPEAPAAGPENTPPAESAAVSPAEPSPPALAAAKPAARTPAKPEAKPEAKPQAKPAETEAPRLLDISPAAPAAAPPASPPAGPASEPDAEDDGAIAPVWVSNLYSTPDAAESEQIWRRLSAAAGTARIYRYETAVGGIRQHRIRLGFFATRAEAQEAGRKLAQDARLAAEPWLVQPSQAEYSRYYGQSLSDHWAVNISSTPVQEDSEKIWQTLSETRAQNFLRKLTPAAPLASPGLYRSETSVSGQRQYRIRLGFFLTQPEAEKAGRDLAAAAGLKAAQIGQPWAVRPTVDEERSLPKP